MAHFYFWPSSFRRGRLGTKRHWRGSLKLYVRSAGSTALITYASQPRGRRRSLPASWCTRRRSEAWACSGLGRMRIIGRRRHKAIALVFVKHALNRSLSGELRALTRGPLTDEIDPLPKSQRLSLRSAARSAYDFRARARHGGNGPSAGTSQGLAFSLPLKPIRRQTLVATNAVKANWFLTRNLIPM